MGNAISALITPVGINNTLVQQPRYSRECSFLHKLPLENRRQIHAYLLVNRMLGQTELELDSSTNSDGEYINMIKYGLSPSILSTNRQIYEEASDVLYGIINPTFTASEDISITLRKRNISVHFRDIIDTHGAATCTNSSNTSSVIQPLSKFAIGSL
ncbi:hypothetical protein N431DRAFT_465954 [Stipitochalara longipes BDJ]|nr:hypothetical protein N431DRAFT_465954 [Stipitochalara longipes BDJ]